MELFLLDCQPDFRGGAALWKHERKVPTLEQHAGQVLWEKVELAHHPNWISRMRTEKGERRLVRLRKLGHKGFLNLGNPRLV